MPRKPLDGREHGARLMMSGRTYATAKSAPSGAPLGLFAAAPDCLRFSQPVSIPILTSRRQQPAPLFMSKALFAALLRGGAPAPLAAQKAHEHRPRSGSDYLRFDLGAVGWFVR
jgi:hypothetical protein